MRDSGVNWAVQAALDKFPQLSQALIAVSCLFKTSCSCRSAHVAGIPCQIACLPRHFRTARQYVSTEASAESVLRSGCPSCWQDEPPQALPPPPEGLLEGPREGHLEGQAR